MLTLFEQEETPQNIIPFDGEVIYYPNFFSTEESTIMLERLLNEITWKQEVISMYGKKINIPRLTAWYGDPNKAYSYSGIPMDPNPWIELLLSIKQKIESIADVAFNSVLLNMYRDGKDGVSWHSDDEKELGDNPTIASVSFGATRTFKLRHIEDNSLVRSVELQHGRLIIMKGETQHKWEHSVPKTAVNALRPRINLTFRVIH